MLRKELDGYAGRFRSLEHSLAVAVRDCSNWQTKCAAAEERCAEALRDKTAAQAARSATQSELNAARMRLERVELEVRVNEALRNRSITGADTFIAANYHILPWPE